MEKVNDVIIVGLAELRKRNKFNQSQLAEVLGISRTMLLKMENGQRNIALSTACKLADLFGRADVSYAGNVYTVKRARCKPQVTG